MDALHPAFYPRIASVNQDLTTLPIQQRDCCHEKERVCEALFS